MNGLDWTVGDVMRIDEKRVSCILLPVNTDCFKFREDIVRTPN